jgi:RNA polymerase sigma-70 factor (ECF subfamily)
MARSVEDRRNPSRERERDLVVAFQTGDQAAFETIVSTCRPAAERICRRLLINPADVEEAVQETLVRAYQGLPRFNGSYALTAWIARIATNVSLDILRASSRRPQSGGPIDPNMETPADHQPNGDRDPEEILEQVLEAEEVRGVLASLPERHRTALVLREFEGYSHRHIAAMLDTSPQRVKALIHRAKAGFRRAWGDDHHPERLAAFAPLLTPINWVRKLLGRAPEFDYATTTSAATTVAASPATQSLVTIASERVSVLATVMLAGTVGLAIQQAPLHSRAAERPAEVQLVEAPAERAVVERAVVEKEKDPKPASDKAAAPPVIDPSPEPTVEASPEADLEGVVLEEPKETGGPDEVPAQPSPEAPTHPSGFGYSFTSDRTADEPCSCGGSPVLNNKSVTVSEQDFSSYEGSLTGAAISDSSGGPAWPTDIQMSATRDDLRMSFQITTPHGTSPYDAAGTRQSTTKEAWGGWTYSYTGTYQWRGGPGEHDDAPHHGSFTAALTWSWAEHRLVWADFSLSESGS